jgi:hypothetical protein
MQLGSKSNGTLQCTPKRLIYFIIGTPAFGVHPPGVAQNRATPKALWKRESKSVQFYWQTLSRAFASNYALEGSSSSGTARKRGSLKIVNRAGQATCGGLTSSV